MDSDGLLTADMAWLIETPAQHNGAETENADDVLVEAYWQGISQRLASDEIPVRHFVLHADQDTHRRRIQNDSVMGPSSFRYGYRTAYTEDFQSWPANAAHIIDTTEPTPMGYDAVYAVYAIYAVWAGAAADRLR